MKRKREKSKTKTALTFLLINGVLWVWCSYVLAFFGKPEIAESLSTVALTEILGVFFTYAAKSLFENLSKNNTWPDKFNKEKTDDGQVLES